MQKKTIQLYINETLNLSNKELLHQFVMKALRYVNLRLKWYVSNQQERLEIDDERTRAHNVFIDYCNIITREMQKERLDVTWRKELGNNRKVLGDFACYIVAEIGIKAR